MRFFPRSDAAVVLRAVFITPRPHVFLYFLRMRRSYLLEVVQEKLSLILGQADHLELGKLLLELRFELMSGLSSFPEAVPFGLESHLLLHRRLNELHVTVLDLLEHHVRVLFKRTYLPMLPADEPVDLLFRSSQARLQGRQVLLGVHSSSVVSETADMLIGFVELLYFLRVWSFIGEDRPLHARRDFHDGVLHVWLHQRLLQGQRLLPDGRG